MSIEFGVGCFHFGYRDGESGEHTPDLYKEKLLKTLTALPAASNISIEYGEAFSPSCDIPSPVPRLFDGDFFPELHVFRLSFDLYIPTRLQTELFPKEKRAIEAGTENFRVLLRQWYYGPVAFVQCLNPSGSCTPSDAVRLVRVYLETQLADQKTPLVFEYLGPSPFHADMHLNSADIPDGEIQCKFVDSSAYMDITFLHSSSVAANDALEEVLFRLGDELALYYSIVGDHVGLIRQGDDLVRRWVALRNVISEGQSSANLIAQLRTHWAAQDIVSDAHYLEAHFAAVESAGERSLRSMYSRGEPAFVEPVLRSKHAEPPHYPVAQIRAWAEHFENSNFKKAELLAIVVSALAGGIVGSALTAAFGSS